jgi:curli biogenesis system outer membrane secretion channel CsgG
MTRERFWLLGAAVVAWALLAGGCASSEETAKADTLTANVGAYDPPPAGAVRARVGIPPFSVTEKGTAVVDESTNSLAADQMTSLAVLSQRFEVIERANLGQLAREQGLKDMVNPAEAAQAGKVSGVDYLIFGKVTNLRVKAEKTGTGFNLAGIPIPFVSASAFDYQNKSSTITAECGVDLRMVQPSTGKVVASHFGEFKRTDSISAFGISILGVGAEAEADLRIDEDNKGKILRLALDEAFRKMLKQVDAELVRLGQERAKAAAATQTAPAAPQTPAASATAPTPAASAAPAPVPQTPAAKLFCTACGKEIPSGARFCKSCGAKVPE